MPGAIQKQLTPAGGQVMFGKKRSGAKHETSASLEAARQYMVQHQLRRRGIADERVLQAMLTVPREEFVLQNDRSRAYEDCPLPIGFDQTISQPYTVAFQCEALQLKGDERVLEIGTGCGYAAAVLSLLAKEVHTIERIAGLADRARKTLARLGYENVHVHTADGTLGLPQHAPFDGIVATAGGVELPEPFVEQLAPGGRIVIPLGDSLYEQSMYRFTKPSHALSEQSPAASPAEMRRQLSRENLGAFCFVPLIGRYGWGESPLE